MSEPRLLHEAPVPDSALVAQLWALPDGTTEVVVQRPPVEDRERPFRWNLSEREIDLLYRFLKGDDTATEEARQLQRDLMDALMVAIWIMREYEAKKEPTP